MSTGRSMALAMLIALFGLFSAAIAAPNAGGTPVGPSEVQQRTEVYAKQVQGFDHKDFRAKDSRNSLITDILSLVSKLSVFASPFIAWWVWNRQGRPQKNWYKTKFAVLWSVGTMILAAAVSPSQPSAEEKRKAEIAAAFENGTIGQVVQADIEADQKKRAEAVAKEAEDKRKAAEKLAAEKESAAKRQAEMIAAQRASAARKAQGLAEAIVKDNIKSPASFSPVNSELLWSGQDHSGAPAFVVGVTFDAQNAFGAMLRNCLMVAFSIRGDDASYKRRQGVQECDSGLPERDLVKLIIEINDFKI